MRKPSKELFELIFVFLSKSTSQGTLFILNVLIARTLLPESYGLWVTMINTLMLLSQLSDLGINTGYIRFGSTYLKESTKLRVVHRLVLRIKFYICLAIIVIGLLFSKPLTVWLFKSTEYQLLIILAVIGSFCLSLFGYLVSFLQIKQWFYLLSKIEVVNNLIRVILIVVLLTTGVVKIDIYILIYCLVPLLIYLFCYFKFMRSEVCVEIEERRLYENQIAKDLIQFIRWVVISSFSVMLISRIDVYIIQYYYSTYEVGLYGSASQLAMIFPLITTSLTTVLLPKVSQMTQSQELDKYIRSIFKFIPAIVVFFVLIILFSHDLLSIVYGEQYHGVEDIFRILLFGTIIGTIINPISLVFYAIRKEKVLTILNVIQLLIALALNLILVPKFSIVGAAIANTAIRVIGGGYILSFCYIYIRQLKLKEYKQKYDDKKNY